MLYSLGVSALCAEEPVRHLHQYIYASANKLQFTAPYIGMVYNLNESTRNRKSIT